MAAGPLTNRLCRMHCSAICYRGFVGHSTFSDSHFRSRDRCGTRLMFRGAGPIASQYVDSDWLSVRCALIMSALVLVCSVGV
jgi:hypothetical protein